MKGRILDLGRLDYISAWDIQKQTHEQVLGGAEDTLILVEHDPVLTLGASFKPEHLLLTEADYRARGIDLVPTDRGGDVTYHGPGQLVCYPIFDLRRHGKDMHRWMRDLEEAMIQTCAEFGIVAGRQPDVNTGAWVNGSKIAAIGVKVRKWVSLHGTALNCENELDEFGLIVPCGVATHGVTSLTRETGRRISVTQAKLAALVAFGKVFELDWPADYNTLSVANC